MPRNVRDIVSSRERFDLKLNTVKIHGLPAEMQVAFFVTNIELEVDFRYNTQGIVSPKSSNYATKFLSSEKLETVTFYGEDYLFY